MLGSAALVACCALCLAPAGALASPQDVAATHAYIQANYALAKASVARIGLEQSRVAAFNAKLAAECPKAGLGSEPDAASQPMSSEVAVALWSIAYGADAGPIRSFVKTVSRLHWSNRKTARLAARYARSLHEYATLPLPDLCEEVRSWRASGFQVVPANAPRIDEHEQAIELEALPESVLAPYERGSDASTLERTIKLEYKLAEAEFMLGQNDWIEVLETLGMHQ